MRIALLSGFWYRRGGLEAVMLQDADALVARGHEVAPFASAHELNFQTSFSTYFPRNIDHSRLGRDVGLVERGREAIRLVRNPEAARLFDRFAGDFEPEIAHQHGISRQLSPSVLERASGRGIPTILSLHDYSIRCPAAIMSRTGEPVCTETSCAGHRYDRAVRFKCVHGDRLASAIAATELLIARALRRYERAVDLFLVPSAYCADRSVEAGIPAARLRVMPNAIEASPVPPKPPGDYFLAFGRLVQYKGFEVVIDAARRMPAARFVIVGDGPDRARLEHHAAGLCNVEFTGHQSGGELDRLVRGACAVVVPSIWAEPFGMVVLEAWRESRAVVVSRRGALPEFLADGRGGLVVEPEDVSGLVAVLAQLHADPSLAAELGAQGRSLVEAKYGMSNHMDRLEAAYTEIAT